MGGSRYDVSSFSVLDKMTSHKIEECVDWLAGICPHAATCKYRHEPRLCGIPKGGTKQEFKTSCGAIVDRKKRAGTVTKTESEAKQLMS